jgi:hypothetical protein
MTVLDAAADLLRVPRRSRLDPEYERYDIHAADGILADPDKLTAALEAVKGGASGPSPSPTGPRSNRSCSSSTSP